MPSKTTASTSTKATAVEAQSTESITVVDGQENGSTSSTAVATDLTKEENLLKEYSKELYVYTLDLLNSVRIDNAHKGVNGKAYMLKRTISDIAVPLKTMEIASHNAGDVKGAKGAAAHA